MTTLSKGHRSWHGRMPLLGAVRGSERLAYARKRTDQTATRANREQFCRTAIPKFAGAALSGTDTPRVTGPAPAGRGVAPDRWGGGDDQKEGAMQAMNGSLKASINKLSLVTSVLFASGSRIDDLANGVTFTRLTVKSATTSSPIGQ